MLPPLFYDNFVFQTGIYFRGGWGLGGLPILQLIILALCEATHLGEGASNFANDYLSVVWGNTFGGILFAAIPDALFLLFL